MIAKSSFEDRYFQFEKSVKLIRNRIFIIYARIKAHRLRKKIIKITGRKVVNKHIKRVIKTYTKTNFGSTAYWPYVALYTEIKGKFVEGWIPYDYFRYILFPRINPPDCCCISEQKTFDSRIFGDFVIRPLFVFVSRMFLTNDFKVINIKQVNKILSDYNNTIVVKQENGCKGKQVRVIHSSEFTPERLNQNINYIIQPYIKQYKVLNDLYPDSINTFRVCSYLNDDGSVDILFAILRFGIDGSYVDNISSGGKYIYFSADGKPSKYAYDRMGLNIGEQHKNTGYVFSNISIPTFHDMIQKCKNAHTQYPYVRLIGWDVCIDESGNPRLVEWNADNPGFCCFEDVHGPFWKDYNKISELKKNK